MSFLISVIFFISLYLWGLLLKKFFLKNKNPIFNSKTFLISFGLVTFQLWSSIIILFNNKSSFLTGGILFILIPFILNKNDLINNLKLKNNNINFIKKLKEISFIKKIEYLILILYFFCCLIPITSADSLDYHVGSAYLYLRNYTYDPTWYTSLLALNGEKSIATLIAIKANPSIQLVQFIGLINIYHSLNNITEFINIKNKAFHKSKLFQMLKLSIISSPILLFLTITAKPQLFPISILVLTFTIIISEEDYEIKFNSNNFILVSILLTSACLNKLTLFLPALIIYLIYIYKFKITKQKIIIFTYRNLLIKILISLIIFSLISIPLLIHRYTYFETNLLQGTLFPLNNFGDYKNFISWIRNYKESPLIFPFFTIFPYGTSNLTTIIGIAPILIIWTSLRYKKSFFLLKTYISLNFLSLFIPNSTRFFYPYFLIISFSLITDILNSNLKESKKYNFIKNYFLKIILIFTILQSMFIISSLLFYNFEYIYYSGNKNNLSFLEKKVNYFDLDKYLTNNLDQTKIIFTDARFRGFSKLKVASLDPLIFKGNDSYSHLLKFKTKNKIQDSEPIYVVTSSESSVGKLVNKCIIKKPKIFYSRYKTRNPFAKQNNKVIKWDIRESKFSDLVKCTENE